MEKNHLPSKWKKWLVNMFWGCCWGGWGGAAPRSSGTLLLGSTCCPSLREVRHVGHEVSCSSHDVKQELSSREGWKHFYDIFQLINFLTLNWFSLNLLYFLFQIQVETYVELLQSLSPECFKLWDIGPLK